MGKSMRLLEENAEGVHNGEPMTHFTTQLNLQHTMGTISLHAFQE